MKLNVWDVGGQKTLRPYWKNFFENTAALVPPRCSLTCHLRRFAFFFLTLTLEPNSNVLWQIFVVDSSDARRLEESAVELLTLLEEDQLRGVPVMVFANKQDLIGAVSETEASQAHYSFNLNSSIYHQDHYQTLPHAPRTICSLRHSLSDHMLDVPQFS